MKATSNLSTLELLSRDHDAMRPCCDLGHSAIVLSNVSSQSKREVERVRMSS